MGEGASGPDSDAGGTGRDDEVVGPDNSPAEPSDWESHTADYDMAEYDPDDVDDWGDLSDFGFPSGVTAHNMEVGERPEFDGSDNRGLVFKTEYGPGAEKPDLGYRQMVTYSVASAIGGQVPEHVGHPEEDDYEAEVVGASNEDNMTLSTTKGNIDAADVVALNEDSEAAAGGSDGPDLDPNTYATIEDPADVEEGDWVYSNHYDQMLQVDNVKDLTAEQGFEDTPYMYDLRDAEGNYVDALAPKHGLKWGDPPAEAQEDADGYEWFSEYNLGGRRARRPQHGRRRLLGLLQRRRGRPPVRGEGRVRAQRRGVGGRRHRPR